METSRQTITVPATGHTEEVIPGTAADCVNSGLTDGVKCTVCGETLDAQEEIPALGHTDGEVKVENEVAADCVNDGHYDNVTYCTVCGVETSRETVTVPATGEHTEETLEGKEATCTEPGLTEGKQCTACGTVTVPQEEIPAPGHNYVDGVCDVCGDVEVMEPDVYLTDITLNFAAKIELRPKFNIPAEVLANSNIRVRVIRDGAKGQEITDYTFSQLKMDSSRKYYVAVPFASGEMGKTLTVQFVDITDGSTLYIQDFRTGKAVTAVTETVANRAIAYMQTAGKSDAEKQLMKAMLVYGGYAQQNGGGVPGQLRCQRTGSGTYCFAAKSCSFGQTFRTSQFPRWCDGVP